MDDAGCRVCGAGRPKGVKKPSSYCSDKHRLAGWALRKVFEVRLELGEMQYIKWMAREKVARRCLEQAQGTKPSKRRPAA